MLRRAALKCPLNGFAIHGGRNVPPRLRGLLLLLCGDQTKDDPWKRSREMRRVRVEAEKNLSIVTASKGHSRRQKHSLGYFQP